MSGNVWEWTRSLWGVDFRTATYKYPYAPADPGQEDVDAPPKVLRVLRGGAFNGSHGRAAFRNRFTPEGDYRFIGFRLVFSRLRN
jgi:formylglycine-generating enzyme required for sulfatase activity